MPGDEAAGRLLVHLLREGHELGPHDVADLPVGRGGEELAEGDDAEEALLGVEDVRVVDRPDLLAHSPRSFRVPRSPPLLPGAGRGVGRLSCS